MDIRRDIFCVFYIYEEGAGTCHHQEKDLYVGLSIYIYKISHVDCLIAFLVRGQEPLWRRSGQKMGTCGIILGQTTFSSKKTILSSTASQIKDFLDQDQLGVEGPCKCITGERERIHDETTKGELSNLSNLNKKNAFGGIYM